MLRSSHKSNSVIAIMIPNEIKRSQIDSKQFMHSTIILVFFIMVCNLTAMKPFAEGGFKKDNKV